MCVRHLNEKKEKKKKKKREMPKRLEHLPYSKATPAHEANPDSFQKGNVH